MDDTKPWYLSRGVIGSVVAIAAGAAAVFNYQIDASLQAGITEEILGIGSLVGGALALWGRIRASRKIGDLGLVLAHHQPVHLMVVVKLDEAPCRH
jgi:hypothetical protein